MIDIFNYYTKEQWNKVLKYANTHNTPCQLILLDIVKNNYLTLKKYLSIAKIYYAIKANPNNEILNELNNMGSNFDIASIYELKQVLKLGISPEKLSYGNTIKKAKDIQEFYKNGVRLYVTDHMSDLDNIAKYAPGSKVFVRILVDEVSEAADWPLSKKFGCDLEMAYDLLVSAKDKGLIPYGVSFHVGSQQKDIPSWHAALVKVKYLFDKLEEDNNIKLKMINMGGGFPAHYIDDINPIKEYCEAITYYLEDLFGKENIPEIIIEPGRSLVGDAGILVTEVVTISTKNYFNDIRWVYIDTGKFNGLAETLNESIKYPIYTTKTGEESEIILAGQTCDSMDILYEDFKYELPDTLEEGDKLFILTTGAYTASYSAINFNGFPPLEVKVLK